MQIASVAAAAALVGALGRGGLVGAAGAVMLVLALPALWKDVRKIDAARGTANPALTSREDCVMQTGLDVGFARWLEGRIPPRGRYQLVAGPGTEARGINMCLSLIMLPRVQVPRAAAGDYLVYFERTPARRSAPPALSAYGAGLAVAGPVKAAHAG